MINGSLSALSAVLNGRLVGEDAPFHGLSTDTRALMPGNLFVALKGERYDAHDLLAAAVAAGAAGVVVEREVDVAAPQIVVADTRLALADLARDWRRRHPIPVVAITGSNGKTTTKELVASILRQHGETLATVGNLNNDIGVPLTLCGLGAEHRYAVIEMGANGPDDIAQLVAIAEPEVALVTMCGPAHLAGFGSLAGVARAKGQIYAQLKPGNTAIINLDDPFHAQWEGTAAPARLLGFGLSESAAVTARDIRPLPLGEGSSFMLCIDGACTEVHLPLDGLHNVRNALAAAAVGVALALPLPLIRAGLRGAGERASQRAALRTGPDGDRRQLQRQSCFPGGGRGDSGRASRTALAGVGRYARTRPGGGSHPSGGWPRRARGRYRPATGNRRVSRRGSGGLWRQRQGLRHARRSAALHDRKRTVRAHPAGERLAFDATRFVGEGFDGWAGGELMLMLLAEWLAQFESGFRVFQYLTLRTVLAAMTSLFISLLVGPHMIKRLTLRQIGQTVRDDGPKSHLSKAGTPTMGGALILVAIAVSTLLWTNLENRFVWPVLATTLCFGAIGWVDDYLKLSRKNPKGLAARKKYFWQSVVAIAVATLLYQSALVPAETRLIVPFFKGVAIELGLLYIAFSYFVIVGTSNAVNLTDGLDGLAILPTVLVAGALIVFAYVTGNVKFSHYLALPYVPGAGEMSVFCAAIVGAGLGFLWFNTYPAQVFMGDIGALALGAALGVVAVVIRQELVLFLMGGVFVAETVSVILQVASFKLTGKRIFRMAPLHHHFELKGWPEPRVIVRFWIITVVLVLLGLTSLKIR